MVLNKYVLVIFATCALPTNQLNGDFMQGVKDAINHTSYIKYGETGSITATKLGDHYEYLGIFMENPVYGSISQNAVNITGGIAALTGLLLTYKGARALLNSIKSNKSRFLKFLAGSSGLALGVALTTLGCKGILNEVTATKHLLTAMIPCDILINSLSH